MRLEFAGNTGDVLTSPGPFDHRFRTTSCQLPGSNKLTSGPGRCPNSLAMLTRATIEEDQVTVMSDAAAAFLANKRIAVTGVSRNPKGHGSNAVYDRLKGRGYEVFAVNPNAETIGDDVCYPNLTSIPSGVDGVVIGTRPSRALETMEECASLGIGQVWMHRGFGGGSVSPEATTFGREAGITVIDGGCPCMFDPAADIGHKAMRLVLGMTKNVPKEV